MSRFNAAQALGAATPPSPRRRRRAGGRAMLRSAGRTPFPDSDPATWSPSAPSCWPAARIPVRGRVATGKGAPPRWCLLRRAATPPARWTSCPGARPSRRTAGQGAGRAVTRAAEGSQLASASAGGDQSKAGQGSAVRWRPVLGFRRTKARVEILTLPPSPQQLSSSSASALPSASVPITGTEPTVSERTH
jgi:hypothetical protein